MPNWEPIDPDDEEIYPADQEDETCSDPDCQTCNPRPITDVLDYGTTTSNTSYDLNFMTTSTTSPVYESQEVEMPESPETPLENSEETLITIPEIRTIQFGTRRGSILRPGQEISREGLSRGTITVSFWDNSSEDGEPVRAAFSSLKEWLVENNLGVTSISNDYFHCDGLQLHIPYHISININRNTLDYDPTVLFSQPNCQCGEEIEYPTAKCPDCEQLLWCSACRSFRSNAHFDEQYGTFCDGCGRTCENCANPYHRSNGECSTCYPRRMCANCSDSMYIGRDNINEYTFENGHTNELCDRCYEGFCFACHNYYAPESILEDEGHTCVGCISRNSNEEWEETSLSAEDIVIPTIPGRETIRLVGMEIEGANGEGMDGHDGGQILARRLYDDGISASHNMSGYHSSEGRRMTVHVERDSSVDWELVIGPMNVADTRDVQIMNRAVRVVRGFINEGTLKLDMRAGMHVHVGADKVPFHNAYNLHKLYMYMEDFLYRLGAAKWPYHRSVNRRGRDQAGKSPITEGKLHFARTFTGNRYYGLSFDNYFARYFEACSCGARQYGLFDECTCELGKCTFEFRLFNTTANTVKIHAYLAICQALVAKAIDMEEIKDSNEFPALDFTKTKASDLHPSTRGKLIREWEKRIVFVNEQLPLTPEEKKSIHYCIMNSEMGKVVSNADILIESEDI